MQAAFHELLSRARESDTDAIQALLVPYLHPLTAFVRVRSAVRLRRRESVSDLVQSIYRQAIGSMHTLSGNSEAEFRQWLYAIALNRIRRSYEYHHAARRDVAREVHPDLDSRVDDEGLLSCYASICTPSREALAREEIERIEAALDSLPEDYREVLVLARISGLSAAEIGEQVGRSEDAVRQLLRRAKARLAERLAS